MPRLRSLCHGLTECAATLHRIIPQRGGWHSALSLPASVHQVKNNARAIQIGDFSAATVVHDWAERRGYRNVPGHAQSWVRGGVQLSGPDPLERSASRGPG